MMVLDGRLQDRHRKHLYRKGIDHFEIYFITQDTFGIPGVWSELRLIVAGVDLRYGH
jgi:hypothetical protein